MEIKDYKDSDSVIISEGVTKVHIRRYFPLEWQGEYAVDFWLNENIEKSKIYKNKISGIKAGISYINKMNQKKMRDVTRGEIYFADLGQNVGSEQNGVRPVVIIQNDVGNKHSPTIIVAILTTKNKCRNIPTHVILTERWGLKESIVMLEQLRTIDKKRLLNKVGNVTINELDSINQSLAISLVLVYHSI